MHNVNVEAVEETAAKAAADPEAAVQPVAFDGEWQTAEGAVQFTAEIPLPDGRSVTFEADYPPHMGGRGQAPNPLAFCFWGGIRISIFPIMMHIKASQNMNIADRKCFCNCNQCDVFMLSPSRCGGFFNLFANAI